MKKTICLLLTAIMVFGLVPMIAARDSFAKPGLKVTGGSYYYDGHPKTVQAEILPPDDAGYKLQYSYYSIYEKATWTEDAPQLTEPGSIVVYVRAVNGEKDVVTHDPVLLEVVGNAPAGSTVKIIPNGSVTKAPVYTSPNNASENVGTLDAGSYCTLLSQDGLWFEVSDGVTTGYVSYEFVNITSRPFGSDGEGAPDLTKVEIIAYGGTYLYDGNVHYVTASLKDGAGFTLEFSVDGGKTWTTNAPGLVQPGKLDVKVHAVSSAGIKEGPDVVLQILETLPTGTDVKIKAHGSNKSAPVRLTAATNGKKLGSLDAGTVVKFIAKEGDWIKVSNGSLEGYVYYWFVDLDNIEIKPVITAEPQDTWVLLNKDATFKVVAQGTGTVNYQWWWNKTGTWEKVPGNGITASYTLTADDMVYNGKKLRCVVTDSNGKVTSREATLTVIDGEPDIKKQPVDSGNLVGKLAVFTVVAEGAETYQWYYRKTATDPWAEVEGNESAKTAALSVKVTNENNGWQFYCKLSNSIPKSKDSDIATLHVTKEAPKIQVQPYADKSNYNEGDTVTISLIASGDAVSYQWQRKLKGKSWEDCTDPSAKTDTLKEVLTYEHDGAQYRCYVRSPLKPKGIKSKTVKIKVKCKQAVIETQPDTTYTVSAGIPGKFEVKLKEPVTGKIKVQWYYSKDGGTKWSKCSKGTNLVLLITKTTVKMNGYLYKCKITRNNSDPLESNIGTLYVTP